LMAVVAVVAIGRAEQQPYPNCWSTRLK